MKKLFYLLTICILFGCGNEQSSVSPINNYVDSINYSIEIIDTNKDLLSEIKIDSVSEIESKKSDIDTLIHLVSEITNCIYHPHRRKKINNKDSILIEYKDVFTSILKTYNFLNQTEDFQLQMNIFKELFIEYKDYNFDFYDDLEIRTILYVYKDFISQEIKPKNFYQKISEDLEIINKIKSIVFWLSQEDKKTADLYYYNLNQIIIRNDSLFFEDFEGLIKKEIKTKNYSKELRHVKKYISNENINKELKPYADSIFKNCNISEGFMINNDSIIWYYDDGSWLIEEDDLKEDEIEPLSKEEKIKDIKSSLNSFSSEHSYIWYGGETFAAGGHYDGLNGINNSNKKRSFIEFGVSFGEMDFLIFHFGLTKKGYKLLSIHNYVWSP
tara:strand:- start:461 stop:1615 length:1155 start_codon:yes stop_codon:yes gene_type:complete